MARGRERLNKRLERLATFQQLTDAEVATLLGPSVTRTLASPVEWDVRRINGGPPTEVRFEVPIFTSRGDSVCLSLHGRITLARPDVSHWILMWGSKARSEQPQNLRRLDLRDDHYNPDGQQWMNQTHKHLWSEASGNSVAYTPTDIPHDPTPEAVGGDDYRQVFEAFVAECKIDIGSDYKWSDPPLDEEQPALPIWEVP